jgi:PAS domain S-box-containing protein
VVVADGWDDERVAAALAAGATAALPGRLADTDPELLAERVLDAADRRSGAEAHRLERERDRRAVLFENNPDPVVRIRFEDGEPMIREVNPAFEDVFGFAAGEVVGSSVVETLVPEDEREGHAELRDRVARGEPLEREAPRLTADGVRRFLFRVIHFGTGPDADGATDAYVWYTDVTERKRRERIVRRLHRSTEAVQEADRPEGVCEAAVDAADEVLDLAAPTCWLEADDGTLPPVAGCDDGGPLESGDPAHDALAEGEARVLDAGELPALAPDAPAVVVPLGDHGLFGAAATGEGFDDVTLDSVKILARHAATALDRVARARELRASERRFRLIAERVDEVIFLAEPDFSAVAYVNPAYEAIWGEPVDALYDDPTGFIDSIDHRDREAFEAGFEAMLADIERGDPDDSYSFEYRVRPGEDEVRWVRATGYPVALDGDGDDGGMRFVGVVEDVTERRELERTYRGVFENVSDGLVIHDPETGEIVDANERFCEMNGYDREELVGETIDLVTGPDHDFEHAAERIRAAREEGPQLFEWRNRHADGETFPVEVHLSVVDIRGEERVLGSVRDITERKRREREYEQIFDMAGDGIVIHDPDTGEVVNANRQVAELLGYDREAFLDRPLSAFQADAEGVSGEDARARIRESARSGGQEFEWPLETADGETVWVRARHEIGEIAGEQRVVALLYDVTERKRREREYEQIFEGVTDAITVHDPETGDIVDCNETMCELTGYDREALLDGGMAAINVPEAGYSTERARAVIDEVMAEGEPRTLEWLVERADGERRRLEVNATPATINGEDRYLAIMRDITVQRRTERRLGAVLDRIDEAIFMTRAEELTSASQAPDYVSSGYEEIWGQSLEAIRERYDDGFFGTLHPEDEADYRSFVEGVVADVADGAATDRYSHEYRIERPDGEVRWVRSDYYPTDWETGPDRIIILSRDVTDRKARERRMASFEDATDDLATADTPAEATRTAVEAATETLDLPAVGAFLYDGDEGVLRPAVLAGPIPEAVDEPIGPGDGPLWEGFATGTVVAPDGGQRDPGFVGEGATPDELGDLAAWRALALGNHGILLVGSPEGSLESETIQAAHVLAATLEAALNHLAGQERLADREEQLRTQTERAERLDRIARLTQQVEAAITDASGPGEVERAVCERLASAGPYDLAWVGGVEAGADRLTPREVVGATDRYVEDLGLTTGDESADPHPAVAAWRSDDLRVADSLVGDGPSGDWRRRALSAGYQSLCAVPLSYDGITHGVLILGSESPNAFGERERAVLSQLGTSIANSLAAIERRRALESDETVELEFRGAGDTLPFARAATAAGCRVRLERTVARQDGTLSVYFGFEDPPDDAVEVAERTLPGTVEMVADESSSLLVEARTDDWFGSPLAEYGGVLREAAADPDGTTVTVEVPRQADVRSFVERLADIAPSLDLVARRQHRRRNRTPAELSDRVRADLTDRQFEVLQTALSAGYFEWPRENDGSEVADRLDITQPTLNKHLRLAERKTFEVLFGDDD